MSSPTAFEAIKNRIGAAWSATPVWYENDFEELPSEPDAFVYVEVFGDSFGQETTGAPEQNVWEEAGTAYLHVYVPKGSGSLIARQHARSLQQLFREQDVDGLKIVEMSIGAGEPGREFPLYWALTLTMFWRRYEITSLP